MKIPVSSHLSEIKFRVLKATMMIAIGALLLVSGINLMNQRPLVNTLLPTAAAAIVGVLLYFTSIERVRYYIKLLMMVFLTNIYLYLGWVTSPGSYSAMNYYAVLLIFISILLAERTIEYLIPLVGLGEMIYLLNLEPHQTAQYSIYSSLNMRAFDLSINFTVVFIIFMIIVVTLNRYFDNEHQRLFQTAITDQLTGVYNRRYLYTQLEQIHARGAKTGVVEPYSLLMIDINHFKRVNDNYGHPAGDMVLIELGSMLQRSCRRNDLPTRFGGDEFILILPNTTDAEANLVADRIREAFKPISERYQAEEVSLGIAILANQGQSIAEMIQQVDDHLYQNKRAMKANGLNQSF